MTDQPLNEHAKNRPEKRRQRKPKGRGRGEGSVFERKDKTESGRQREKPWVAQVTLENGKQKTIGYFKTEAEAISAKNKALREIEQGAWIASSKQTMAQYLNYWLEHVHKPTLKPTTYANYRSALNSHIIPVLGYIQVQKLTVRHIQMFYSDLINKHGLSAARVRYLHGVLHVAMEHAVREGLVVRNICRGIQLPRVEKKELQVLTLDQASHLLAATQDSEMRVLLMLAVTTGLRLGELLALKWQDVDLIGRSLRVRRSLAFLKGRSLVEVEPKTVHSRRKITLPQFVVDALEKHQIYQQQIIVMAGDTWQEHDLIFCNKHGGHIHHVTLQTRFKRIVKVAGLPPMHFHGLRHSAITILLQMGVPPHVVQEIAGHGNIRITLGTYGHVLPGQQEDAMNKWDNALGKRNLEE